MDYISLYTPKESIVAFGVIFDRATMKAEGTFEDREAHPPPLVWTEEGLIVNSERAKFIMHWDEAIGEKTAGPEWRSL